MARPLLLVIALWQFTERNRYPEVVVSFVLQLWRSHLTRGRWPSHPTDISRKDVEAQSPLILNSRTSAASFFSCEQLGVTPPPAAGWVPRDNDKEETGSESRAEWWGNINTSEWMYHSAEDKYFHVPSSTLWERRETECCDPTASPHTYCRVDAVHLQALSHFAKAMDTALLPMVWKAWVFYTRKRNGRYDAEKRHPAPPDAGLPRTAPEGAAADNFGSLGEHTDAPDSFADRLGPPGGAHRGCGQGSPDAGAGKGAVVADDTSEAELLNVAAAGIEQLAAGAQALKKALTSTTDTLDANAKAPSVPAPASPTEVNSLVGERPRGWCLCFRVRSRRGRTRCASEPPVAISKDVGMDVPPVGFGSEVLAKSHPGAAAGLRREALPAAVGGEEEQLQEAVREAPQTSPGGVDRHTRRLLQFLAEVKRNPQRLITHVEKRRSERTPSAFMLL